MPGINPKRIGVAQRYVGLSPSFCFSFFKMLNGTF